MTLIERLEAASGPSYALDCAIGEYVAKATGTPYIVPPKPYTASIDRYDFTPGVQHEQPLEPMPEENHG